MIPSFPGCPHLTGPLEFPQSTGRTLFPMVDESFTLLSTWKVKDLSSFSEAAPGKRLAEVVFQPSGNVLASPKGWKKIQVVGFKQNCWEI